MRTTFYMLGCFFLTYSWGQVSEVTSPSFEVSIAKDHPTQFEILSPQILNEKSRGFKKIKEEKLEIRGVVKDIDGISGAFLNEQSFHVSENDHFNLITVLEEGLNELVFKVVDVRGNVFTKQFQVILEFDKEANALIDLGDELGKYYALLIGINDYKDPEISDLDRPIGDVRKIGKVFSTRYVMDSVIYLENPTRRELIEGIENLRNLVTPKDNLILFYAGHGFWDETGEIGYWIPSDASTSIADWVRNTTLSDQLRTINSRHTLIIADACFSGSLFRVRSLGSGVSMAINRKYEKRSRKAMTSGTLSEVPDKSVFVNYLVSALEDNQERYLTASSLFYSFEEAVINNSENIPQYGTIQNTGDEGGEFIFILK